MANAQCCKQIGSKVLAMLLREHYCRQSQLFDCMMAAPSMKPLQVAIVWSAMCYPFVCVAATNCNCCSLIVIARARTVTECQMNSHQQREMLNLVPPCPNAGALSLSRENGLFLTLLSSLLHCNRSFCHKVCMGVHSRQTTCCMSTSYYWMLIALGPFQRPRVLTVTLHSWLRSYMARRMLSALRPAQTGFAIGTRAWTTARAVAAVGLGRACAHTSSLPLLRWLWVGGGACRAAVAGPLLR